MREGGEGRWEKGYTTIIKTVFIIPGFRESAATKGYKEVASIFRKRGYQAVIISIHWNHRTMTDYISQAKRAIGKENDVILFGFSFGAIIAACIASESNVRSLFLCSLSPYFKEDLGGVPDSWKKFIGKRRLEDFSRRSFAKIASDIDCPTHICLGEKESKAFPSLKKRGMDASMRIKKSSMTVIPNAGHDLGDPAYQRGLSMLIEQKIV